MYILNRKYCSSLSLAYHIRWLVFGSNVRFYCTYILDGNV